jgi:hypothetical protein
MMNLDTKSSAFTNVANAPSMLELSEGLKEFCKGLVIQVDIGGHPPIPTGSS